MRRLLQMLMLHCLLFSPVTLQAQKEANIWYLGDYAGLDFNVSPPQLLNNSDMKQLEGTSTVCDSAGNLMFYSNGRRIWDNNHETVDGSWALSGHYSSTQAALILPMPANPDIFYFFSTDAQDGDFDGYNSGLRYSKISICADGGENKILESELNEPLLKRSSEKVTAVHHKNNTDLWVLGHEFGSNKFYVYKITEEGLDVNPKIVEIGAEHNDSTTRNTLGYMKVSPDGSRLAVAIQSSKIVEVYDFNNENGDITNPITLHVDLPYGVEFSPNSDYLYVTTQPTHLYQFHLSGSTEEEINSSKKVIYVSSEGFLYGLQLGPDQIIYTNTLQKLYAPGVRDDDVYFDPYSPSLTGAETKYWFGLPNINQSYVDPKPDIYYSTPCGTSFVSFRLTKHSQIASVKWDFADSLSEGDTSHQLRPSYNYKLPGNYLVRAEVTLKNGATLDLLKKVVIRKQEKLLRDVILCDKYNYTIDASVYDDACYMWEDGSSGPTLKVNETGWYKVLIQKGGCTFSDSTYVLFEKTPDILLPEEDILCENSLLWYDVSGGEAENYQWSTGSTSPYLEVNQEGVYWVEASNAICSIRDTVNVKFQSLPDIYIPEDTFLCEDKKVTFELADKEAHYEWSNGSMSNQMSVSSPGMYSLISFVDENCKRYDTVKIDLVPKIEFNFSDTLICTYDSITADAYTSFSDYYWSTGSSDSALVITEEGNYSVYVENVCYSKEISFSVIEENCDCDLFVPNVITPNGDGLNDHFFPVVHQNVQNLKLIIFNRWGGEVYSSMGADASWSGKINGNSIVSGVYFYAIEYNCFDFRNQSSTINKQGYVQVLE